MKNLKNARYINSENIFLHEKLLKILFRPSSNKKKVRKNERKLFLKRLCRALYFLKILL